LKLQARLVLYLVAVNALATAAALPFLAAHRLFVVAAEVLLAASLLIGLRLVRSLFRTLEVVQEGSQLLDEKDFTTRMRETGRPDLDQLVRVYNRMADHLRNERIRQEEQHHFLSQILEQSPSGIVVLDLDGAIELCNPAARRLLDWPPGVAVRSLTELEGPLARELQSLTAGETRVVSLSDGRRLKVRRGTFQDRGFARGFFLIEELTEELRQAEKAAYEKLIRMMSHEVNNSVGATGSLLHSCLNYRPLLPEEHGRDLETALRVVISRTEQLGTLMRRFAELVRLPPPQRVPTDPAELLRRVEILMRGELERRRIRWIWAGGEALRPIDLDPIQIEQVLVNVVKNAAEAIAVDGSITVRSGRQGARPTLAIEDSGPGIPAEARAQLFTPFFTTKESGQGIGLMLIQQVLDQHRFDYALESPPGGPTRFTVVFR
jgi:signal transduction histidine kinase